MSESPTTADSGRRTADVAVIGGGIVGLAMADEIAARYPQADVVVLEKEPGIALHASGRNSGVLHAGFYYAPDSLKAVLTRRGNELLKQFAAENSVPVRNCGKVVVATAESQLPGLQTLFDRGVANGVPVEKVDLKTLHELEPLARSVGWALWSPTTAVADPVAMCEALAARARRRGVRIITDAAVQSADGGRLVVAGQRWDVGHVVNAAGLYADRVARWYGYCDDYVVLPFKGLYWYGNWPTERLRRHVYPVPDPLNPFLGVHLTVTSSGGVKLGPTAIPALWREDYSGLHGFRRDEFVETLAQYPRFLTSPHHNVPALIRSEVPKYLRRELVRQARALVPAVAARDFRVKGKPGVRAQLWSIPGRRLEMDFVVRGDAQSTHLLNVVSPGWTTSLSVAQYVVDQMVDNGAL